MSGIRALGLDLQISLEDDFSRQFVNYYREMGQPLFDWAAPDGYPDDFAYWLNTTSMLKRWQLF